MINNPFILIGDIPAPYFCDRIQETARLVKGIHGGENICLVSERRMEQYSVDDIFLRIYLNKISEN